MRKFVVLAVLIGACFAAVGEVTITFWHAMGRARTPFLEKLTQDFMAQNPGIKVELIYQGGYGALSSKLIAAVAAGEPPTISQQYENWTTQWLDALVDLDQYLSPEVIADIHPRHLQYFEGRLVTVPFNKSIIVLYYRPDLVPVPPTSWEEFLEMAKAHAKDLDGDGVLDTYGTAFRPAPNPEIFLTFLAQNEGSILSPDWTEVTINNERGLEVAKYVAELGKYALIQSAYISDAIAAGKSIAGWIDTSAGYPYNMAAAKTAGVPLSLAPTPCGRICASMIQGTNLAIFSLNQSEEQIQAAASYIEFLLRPENTVYWAENTGYLPVTIQGFRSERWQRLTEAQPEFAVMTEEFVRGGFSQLLHPNYWDMREALSTWFELLMLGEVTPEEFVEGLADEIQALL